MTAILCTLKRSDNRQRKTIYKDGVDVGPHIHTYMCVLHQKSLCLMDQPLFCGKVILYMFVIRGGKIQSKETWEGENGTCVWLIHI